MSRYTVEQLEAINLDGENIIVSAGAGSGKTMVLTHRVLRKLEDGISIKNLLILTFTKLAANEMKNRIRDELKKRIELSEELKKIDSSYITTFDSFSLSLVKKYHYLLNVKKNVNIIESNVLNIKTKEYLDNILEEEYQERREDFTKLINDFCIKDDNNIREAILSINDDLNLKYEKEEYLNNYIKKFYSDNFINKNVDRYIKWLKDIIDEINKDLTKISHEVDTDYYHELNNILTPLANSHDYDEIRRNTINIKLPNLPRSSSDETKKYKESISNNIKKILELTELNNTNELLNSIKLTKPYIQAIIRIIKKLDQKINNYKYENDLYDFSDICKMAIKLVKEHENIREEIKNSFNEIMIDEYQDTSDLQEEFINLISNNNVYVVGDVKQSIYRFRNANPDIFRNKYNLYTKNQDGKKIDLLKNFRSREEVLYGVNLIFSFIMDDFIGGANYKESHEMIPGNIEYQKDENNNLEIYQYDDNNYPLFSKEEIEAFIISDDIKRKVNNHYQVFDKKKHCMRDVTYDDFAILVDRSGSFTTFKKVFLYKKIPLSIYQDEKLNESPLFMVIRNIFRLVDLVNHNSYSKEIEYVYLSIGRSFLYNHTDEYLFDTITSKTYKDTDIFDKIMKLNNNISGKSISDLLDEIIKEFDIYNKLRSIPDIDNNYVKIEYLYNLASSLNKMGYNIFDFDDYLNNILDNEMDIKFSINKEDGVSVKIMTIHASKGLEYPICYYPCLYKEFNDRDIKSKIIFSNLLGMIIPYYNDGITDIFYRELLKREYYKDEVSEKIRLFYVALTRAREKMILVMPNKEIQEEYENDLVSKNIRLSYRSFLDIILSIKSKLTNYIKNIKLEEVGITLDYKYIISDDSFNNNDEFEKINLIDYPKTNNVTIEESHFSKSSFKIFTKEEKEKMNFGSKIHYYLETLDLKNPDTSDIKSPYKEKIESFLICDLLKNINEAKVYQEYEFIEDNDNVSKHGVIDLMLEYNDHIDIIDYKLKNIDDDAYIIQLSGYRDYINKLTNKETNIYLYSIIDGIYKKL